MLRSAVPMRLETDTRRGLSLALAAFAIFGAPCGSSSTAKNTPAPRPVAPPGAKAPTCSGTTNGRPKPQPVTAAAVAFVHGAVFVIVVHGPYAAAKYPVDAAALAATVNTRLDGIPGTS